MKIILEQKDADFILKYIRADLEKVTDANIKIAGRTQEFLNELKEQDVKEDSVEGILAKNLLAVSDKITNASIEIKNDLLKCIELLTVGSEVSNETA